MANVNFDSFINDLVSPDDIQRRANDRFDSPFIKDSNGELRPFVCSVCNEPPLEKGDDCQITISKMQAARKVLCWDCVSDPRRTLEIEDQCKFDGSTSGFNGDLTFLTGMALSPRASLCKKSGPRSQWGFSCCKRCHGNIAKKEPTLPRHAILNKNCVGCAPDALLDLNKAELAFLSPVKNHGHCFTHTGGTQQLLKGTCTFMRVSRQGIVNLVSVLEDLGLTKHVLVVFTGKMTKEQKKRARERSTVHTDCVTPALHWLKEKNTRWKDIDIEKVREGLRQHEHVIIDGSEEVDSQNANVEQKELFTVFCPNGVTTPNSGGFDQPSAFKECVQELASQGFSVEFQSLLEKKFTKDSEADILMDACSLQCPHGIGGMDESRLLHDESFTNKSDLFEHFDHG